MPLAYDGTPISNKSYANVLTARNGLSVIDKIIRLFFETHTQRERHALLRLAADYKT